MLITSVISLHHREVRTHFHNQLLIAFKMSQRWNTCNLARTVSKLMGTTETLHWPELEMREAGHCLGRYERCFGVSGDNISTGPIFKVYIC